MPKKASRPPEPDGDEYPDYNVEPNGDGTRHRNRYEVTLDRLAAMSTAELKTLGMKLREHEAGEHMWKMLSSGYRVQQGTFIEGT